INVPLQMMIGVRGLQPGGDPAAALPLMFGVMGIAVLLNLFIGIAYHVYFWSTRGATPGKMALGLKIIHPDGSGLTVGQALGRYLGYILSGIILYIGFMMAG